MRITTWVFDEAECGFTRMHPILAVKLTLLVEVGGLEPPTSGLQSQRSPN
jgi:hypothetical protein